MIQAVNAGQCFKNEIHSGDRGEECALESIACIGMFSSGTGTTTTEGSSAASMARTYESSQQLENYDAGYENDRVFSECLRPENAEAVPIGRCFDSSQDLEVCTSVKEACTVPDKFQPNAEGCMVANENRMDSSGLLRHWSLYGRCDDTCVWSQDDCLAGEAWYPATHSYYNTASKECTCDVVQVGACKNPKNKYSCGISSFSCDEFSTYISARDLKGMAGAPDCRLCMPVTPSSVGSGFGKPVAPEDGPQIQNKVVTLSPSLAPVIFSEIESLTAVDLETGDKDDFNAAAIIGGVFGGILGVAVLGLGFKFFSSGRRSVMDPQPADEDPSDIIGMEMEYDEEI